HTRHIPPQHILPVGNQACEKPYIRIAFVLATLGIPERGTSNGTDAISHLSLHRLTFPAVLLRHRHSNLPGQSLAVDAAQRFISAGTLAGPDRAARDPR